MAHNVSFATRRKIFNFSERYYWFMHSPWAGGVMLVVFMVLALVLGNLPATKGWYYGILQSHFTIGFDGFALSKSIEHWINDGLMVIFFFYVGLEIKREIIAGERSSPRQAAMPIAAAVGGMLFPAAIYLVFNHGNDYASGWGIPMATDIAFAIGVLSLLGNRVPLSLKVFLTALAIVDDLGAILVIALFYSTEIDFTLLIAAGAVFGLLILLNRMHVYAMKFYLIPSIVLWILFLYSGVHATIAGVLIALTIPAVPRYSKPYFIRKTRHFINEFRRQDRAGVEVLCNPRQLKTLLTKRKVTAGTISPAQRLEHSLHHTVAFFIMPVFALANAGVEFAGAEDLHILYSSQGLGIILGLVVGKPLGIMLMSYLVYRLGLGSLPHGVSWKALAGVACLAGIGFTMSIFIDNLAYDNPVYVSSGKIAILAASTLAAVVGLVGLQLALRRTRTVVQGPGSVYAAENNS